RWEIHFCGFTSHSRTVRSLPPEARRLPSGLQATDHTQSVCPASVLVSLPVATSHSLIVRVRHEGGAETVLLFAKEVTTPAVLPAVSSRGVPPWQRGSAKPSAQRLLILRDGDRSVSRSRDCQHQGGRARGVRGRVNPGAP